MTTFYDTLKDALLFYDKHSEENKILFKKVNNVIFLPKKDNIEYRSIELYDKDNTLITGYKYEIIGAHYVKNNAWVWAWAIPLLNKNVTNISRKILNYGLELDGSDNELLKIELITSRFFVEDVMQVDLYIALSAYLSKNSTVYPYRPEMLSPDIVWYLILY
jgi:hypothetical protein